MDRGTEIRMQIFQETQVQISPYFLWKNLSQDTNLQTEGLMERATEQAQHN